MCSLHMRSRPLFKMAEKGKAKKSEQLSQERIISIFQQLRMEQRAIATKISELEAERNEHNIVMEALKKVSPDRKCFRTIGGVLVERTVKEVFPALKLNSEQLAVMVNKLMDQLGEKGKELNTFKLKHNIRIREEGEDDRNPNTDSSKPEPSSQGILIA